MISAFFIGLFGSVHCLGMCGPLAMTFAGKAGGYRAFVTYHIGRLLVYGLIGLLFGLIGLSLYFFRYQQLAAIVLGVIIVLIYGFPGIRNRLEGLYYHSRFYQSIKTNLTNRYSSRVRWFAAGMLNGFLPCGMIYLAAAGATIAGDPISSIQFMLLFGLGTIPMFLGLVFFQKYAPALSRKMSNLTTPIALLAGIVLIVRGVIIRHPDLSELMRIQVGKLMTACGI